MQRDNDVLVNPSFNSYSYDGLASIAAKVSDEFMDDKYRLWESFDDEFEFSLVIGDEDITADDVFSDGQIRPIFPIFDRNLVTNHDKNDRIISVYDDESIRIPLKKLFTEDHEDRSSTSSSESDELESIPAGSYCVWSPEFADRSPSRWKKSGSTGSGTKKWKLRDLLRRCNSDGKGPFVLLTPKPKVEKMEKVKKVENSQRKSSGDGVIRKVKTVASGASPSRSSSPHEMFYVRNRAEKGGGKRKSYLPYRRDLVGIFARVNGMGKYHAF